MATKAFPCTEQIRNDNNADFTLGGVYRQNTVIDHTGMDLLDYFAAKAMQGMMSNIGENEEWDAMEVADIAYMVANRMMEVRNG